MNIQNMSSSYLIESRSKMKKEICHINKELHDRFSKYSGEIGSRIVLKPRATVLTSTIIRNSILLIEDGVITKYNSYNSKSETSELLNIYTKEKELMSRDAIDMLINYENDITVFEDGELVAWKISGVNYCK